MNEYLQLYSWVRGGAAISQARIAGVASKPSPPGQELVTLELRIEELLYGPPGESLWRFEAALPVSEIARLKFPDPLWGRVRLEAGVPVLLVTRGRDGSSPLYVEEIIGDHDRVMNQLRAVVSHEKSALGDKERTLTYLRWLSEGGTVEKLFGAEALANDNLPSIDADGRVAVAFVRALGSERDQFTRVRLEIWMWEKIYPRTNPAGKVAILNEGMQDAADPSGDIARVSLDHFVEIDSLDFRQAGVTPTPQIIPILAARLQKEKSPGSRAHIQKIIESLRR
jgi:hypothetical protein